MVTPTQVVPGYYVWEPPGSPVIVHLSLDVVDRLSAEVMRGFGAVRKRGAEIGGLLTGTVEDGLPTVVRIDGYETVPCEYRLGPSYQFAEEDSTVFEEAFDRVRPIGYFRSHTRDGLSLVPEDGEILNHFFQAPANIALIIKPYAMTASVAGVFVRVNGTFPEVSPLEFPFRRSELMGGRTTRRALPERRSRLELPTPQVAPPERPRPESVVPAPAALAPATPTPPAVAHSFPPLSWGPAVWMTLISFLLLGGSLGFEMARSLPAAAPPGVYALSLRVVKNGDNLSVTWNGQSAMAQRAQNGVLEIEDGATNRPVALDPAQLRNGRVIYRNTSSRVRFRLTVYPEPSVSVSESTQWTP